MWRKLLTDERGFFQLAIPAGLALLSLLRKPGVQKGLEVGGQVIGNIAKRRGEGRQQETANQQNQAQTEADIYRSMTNALMQRGGLERQRAEFERDSPSVRAQQSALGNAMVNTQDVGIGGGSPRLQRSLVNFTGGLRPSALGNRAAGYALEGIGTGNIGKDTFEVPDLPAPPQLQGLPQASLMDKILGIAGPAAGLAGILGQNKYGYRTPDFNPQAPSTVPEGLPGAGPFEPDAPPDQSLRFPRPWRGVRF